ncbi:MAG: T9SS type A sorting domain-containing protein [Marinilabiliaceae bacterium]|nr:T9SS type A sorting domain-containing protein [Marinilabiliaceae bacterium]
MNIRTIVGLLILQTLHIISSWGQSATIPYEISFEEGWNDNGYWNTQIYPSGVAVTAKNEDAKDGNYSLDFYQDFTTSNSSHGLYCEYFLENGADLIVNLVGKSSAFLHFYYKINAYSVGDYGNCFNNFASFSGIYLSPNGSDSVKVFDFFETDNNWQYVTLNLYELANTYGISFTSEFQIKFRSIVAYDSRDKYLAQLLIDNVSITDECQDHYTFSNLNNLHELPDESGIYSAINYIIADNLSIQATTIVNFIADNYILLQDGFIAEEGSYFNARIGSECSSSLKSVKNKKPEDDLLDLSEDLNFSIFPNPSNGNFEVKSSIDTENWLNTIKIFNIDGHLIYSKNFNSSSCNINLSFNNRGIYFIEICCNGIKQIERIVIN